MRKTSAEFKLEGRLAVGWVEAGFSSLCWKFSHCVRRWGGGVGVFRDIFLGEKLYSRLDWPCAVEWHMGPDKMTVCANINELLSFTQTWQVPRSADCKPARCLN